MSVAVVEQGIAGAGTDPATMAQRPSLLPYAVLALAVAHYNARRALTAEVAQAVLAWWARLDRDYLDESWYEEVQPGLVDVLAAAQRRAVDMTEPYMDAIESAWSERVEVKPPLGRVQTESFVGQTADQRDITGLLDLSLIRVKVLIGAGMPVDESMQRGSVDLVRAMVTETKDAGREADGTAVVIRPTHMGYYRMLNLPSCDRCVVLAGKWYRWSEGFLRHDLCDCEHVPAMVGKPGERRVDGDYDPTAFDPMAAVKADLITGLTLAERKAILEDGADLNKIVNAKRTGLRTLVGGPRQRARRPTAAYIYNRAGGDREQARRDLIRWGYILPT